MHSPNDKIIQTKQEGEIMEQQVDLEIDIDEDEQDSWFGLGRK